jgi:hypothetical protein
MTKIVIIPVNSPDEISMFQKTIILGIYLNSLQPILFIKLFELLQRIHANGPFPIWGVASGEKSSEANKWNMIGDNDVVLFARNNKMLGYAIVKTKFQSESVARELWPDLHSSQIRQYLFTLEKYVEIDDQINRLLEPICRRGKFQFDSFQLIENQFSLEFIRALGLEEIELTDASAVQGFGLTATEKKSIEQHAVKLAIEHLSMLGYTEIEDVGDKESFDLRAVSPEKQISVEVKGSTGVANSVVLTRNEVSFQKDAYPLNGLFVVSNIELIRGTKVSAQGGDIKFISPWLIDESSLKAISYQYRI